MLGNLLNNIHFLLLSNIYNIIANYNKMYTSDGENLTMYCLCMITMVLLTYGNRKRNRKRKKMLKSTKYVLNILYA